MSKNDAEHERRRQREQVEREIKQAMSRIGRRIVVFSGKGGVGKTTVAVNLAYALLRQALRVGLLDADVTGPNVVQMTGVKEPARIEGQRLVPHERAGLRLVSLASMLPPDAPVIWRGPMRSKAIEQLLDETEWGDLDVLIVDLPPGTGDEVLTITQRILPHVAIVVTTPQEVALIDARRAINFAKKLNVPAIGVVENMSGFVCPHCREQIDLLGAGTGRASAAAMGVRFFGAIPLDPAVPVGCDAGRPIVLEHPESPVSEAIRAIAVQALFSNDGPRGPN